jgi:hypothetical protein
MFKGVHLFFGKKKSCRERFKLNDCYRYLILWEGYSTALQKNQGLSSQDNLSLNQSLIILQVYCNITE